MGHLDYGLIGNCQVSALIDRQGTYVWACSPRLDSPAIFCSLLDDKKGGAWSVLPETPHFDVIQTYVPNTNILKTAFHLFNG